MLTIPTQLDKLQSQSKSILSDGGMATELERLGHNLSHPLWSAQILNTAPEDIQKIHLEYLQDGSQIISTVGYQLSRPALSKENLSKNQIDSLFLQSIQLASQARDHFCDSNQNVPKPCIGVSMGPYGAFLQNGSEYDGQYDVPSEVIYSFHLDRIQTYQRFRDQYDFLIFETIPLDEEILIINEIMQSLPDTPYWISKSKPVENTSTLISLQKGHRPFAFGFNCCSPQDILPRFHPIKSIWKGWKVAYPNSGEKWNRDQQSWSLPPVAMDFTQTSLSYFDHGIEIVGGCCRTSPKDIETIHLQTHKTV